MDKEKFIKEIKEIIYEEKENKTLKLIKDEIYESLSNELYCTRKRDKYKYEELDDLYTNIGYYIFDKLEDEFTDNERDLITELFNNIQYETLHKLGYTSKDGYYVKIDNEEK